MRSLRTAAVAALVPLCASLLLVPSAQADVTPHVPVWDNGPGGERYVALGDSFTSGPGIAPMRESSGCERSERNFPSLLAEWLGVTAFTDASCGGATTADLWAPQRDNAPQLDALSEDTTLVTFGTIGGNDIGLVGLAADCVYAHCLPAAGQDPYAVRFAAVEESLRDGIAAARTRAPDAEIAVIGYSTYVPPGGCPATFGGLITTAEFDYLQSQIDRLSAVLADVADETGSLFVDMTQVPGAVDHTVCAAPDRQWIRALEPYGDGVVFHPSACGMDAMAQHLRRVLAAERGDDVPPFDDSCVSAGPSGPDPDPRLRALRAKAGTVDVRVSCLAATKRRPARVRFAARGGGGALAVLRVRAGEKRIVRDAEKPFRADRRARRVQRKKGALTAIVRVRDRELSVFRTLRLKRPRCI
jgi:lysophospholipase L1-like esterase